MNKIKPFLLYAFIVLSLVGVADAAYLTWEYFRGEIPACSVVSGCEAVLTSKYASIGPVPLSLLGLGYYATVYFLSLGALIFRNIKLFNWAVILTGFGFLVSMFLLYLQTSVIRDFCFYCLISATISTLLLAIGVIFLKYGNKEQSS